MQMDFGTEFGGWEYLLFYSVAAAVFVLLLWGLSKLVRWAKTKPAAYLILALFPLISLFPIPPAEIKKLQRIKQEQVKRKQESGDPSSDDEPTAP